MFLKTTNAIAAIRTSLIDCFLCAKKTSLLLKLFALAVLFLTGFSTHAQTVYNYTVEGFDDVVFPTTRPTVETPYTSGTGTWKIFNGNRTTGTDPCPQNGVNGALRLTQSLSAYVISPKLTQGAGVVTWRDNRSNKIFTFYTSTDDGATWSSGTNLPTSGANCNQILVNVNNAAVNRIKIANLQGNDMGVDSLLITAVSVNAPTVTTTTASSITFVSASSGGNVTADGGSAVTARGIVWSTSTAPTTAVNLGMTTDGTGTGTFTSSITGLSAGITYYYRAYATNSIGTSYGTEYSFTTPAASPTLLVSPAALTFGNTDVNTFSNTQSYVVSGFFFSPAAGNITITAPAGFKVSTNSSTGFSTSITIPYTGSALANTTIYVRFEPTTIGAYSGVITNAGGGATTQNVAVTGVGATPLPNFTNLGLDFWTGFGYQEKMNQKAGASGEAKLSIYVSVPSGTTAASVVIDLPGIPGAATFPRTITVTPGTVTEVTGFPTGDAASQYNPTNLPDTRLYYTGVSSRGIHIYSTNGIPISVWMHSYTTGNSAAGAMLFPTNTWSNAYTVQAYGGYSNNSNPNSFFFVVAKEDNTPIWIKPSQPVLDSIGGSSGTLFTDGHIVSQIKYQAGTEYGPIYLNKGQVFNAMGFIQGSGSGITTGKAFGLDLSGSTVRTSCDKSIAVFGGNGRVLINGTGCSASSGSDHLIQQMFPSIAWGKKYLTTPTTSMEFNLYRINVSDPATQVWVNNPTHTTPLTGLINNLYYEIQGSQPQMIESDRPITVTQFIVAEGCANQNGSKGLGDPEMIILSPVEQAITNTTVYSATIKNPSASYNGHYINVVIRKGGVASFRLDGGTTGDPGIDQSIATSTTTYNSGGIQPLTSIFKPHPADTNYYYVNLKVTPGTSHTLTSDSAFNAIAYGMGDGESYGYNAGASLKDLSQMVLVQNQYSQTEAIACKDNSFYLKFAMPYAPADVASLTWDFFGNANMNPNAIVNQVTPTADSSFAANGTTYYVYKLPAPYQFSAAGTYSFRVTANIIGSTGCTGIKVMNQSITVVNKPVANFTPTIGTCGNLTVQFADASTAEASLVSKWSWDFGNASVTTDTSTLQNPGYTYPTATTYNVSLRAITSLGCFHDTTKTIDISSTLNAAFSVTPSATVCAGGSLTFSSSSVSSGTSGTITQWNWNFGDGSPVVNATTGADQSHVYATAGNYVVTLNVQTSAGCTSNTFQVPVTVNPVPSITSATTGSICNNDLVNYTINSNVSGTTYTWSRNLTAGISNAAVSGQTSNPIIESLSNTGNAAVNVVYNISGNANGCSSAPFTYTVTVNPTAVISSTAAGTICSGVAQGYNITSNVTGASFSWSRASVAGISNTAVTGQTNPVITEALVNTTNAPVVVRYVITPSFAGCTGTSFNYDVTVNPVSSVNSAALKTICSGASVNHTLTATVTGSTFSWDRAAVTGISNTAVTAQTANPITESLINTTNAPVNVTYVITPSANGCAGTASNFVVTVNPTATITSAPTATVCGGSPLNYNITSNVSGATFTWSRAAIAGISNAAVSGMTTPTITETLINTTNAPIVVRYVIVPSANGCPGTSFNYDVTVNPTPAVNPISPISICSGTPLSQNITGIVSGTTFTWNRASVTGISNPAASGQTANPIAETLINTSNAPVNVTYVITPSLGTCTGSTSNFVVTVNPTVNITSTSTGTVCSNNPLNYTISSNVSTATFTWNRAAVAGISNTSANGSSASITETLVNTTNTPVDVTYVITASANGCTSASFNYVVTVNPTATVTSAASGTICSGAPQNYLLTSSVTAGTSSFTWSRTAVTGISNAAASGSSFVITESLVNTTNAPVVVRYVIIPSFAGCAGTPFNYDVTVNPTPVINNMPAIAICNNGTVNQAINGTVSGTSYTWSRAAVSGISNSAVTGQTSNPIVETLTNTGNTPAAVTYTITPTANSCAGSNTNFVVTVNPSVNITSAATGNVCSGTALNYSITSNVSGATFSWSRTAVAGISNAAVSGQTTALINETLLNTTSSPVIVTYNITSAANSCAGSLFSYTVTVNPTPVVSFTYTNGGCTSTPVVFSSPAGFTSYTWNFGDGGNSTQQNPSHTYTTGGSFSVTLTAVNSSGCSAVSAPQTVIMGVVLTSPVITSQPSVSSIVFSWPAVTGAVSYEVSIDGGITWTPANGSSGLSHTVTGLTTNQTVNIMVRVNGTLTCQRASASASATTLLPELKLYVPNTFSPNGDGHNDLLKVYANSMNKVSMKIFNQWGELIYSENGTHGWDGKVNGKLQPVGVYAYVVVVTLQNGKVMSQKGLFNLLH
jgi:gliding motility-associated-like protein